MSSRIRNKGKVVNRSTDWSIWEWDEPNYQWYRTRTDADGNYEYEYRAAEETPRSETGNTAGISTTSWTTGGANQTSTYYQNDQYSYETPQSGDISALSETFGRVDITTGERPGPTRFTSFDNSSSRVGDLSGALSIPAASNPLKSDEAADYVYPSSAPARGYMTRTFDSRPSVDPRYNIPEDSAALEQAPASGVYPSGFSMTPNPTFSSRSPDPVFNYDAQQTSTTDGFSGGNVQPGSVPQYQDTGGAGSSGAITPKAEPHLIKGTPGDAEPLYKHFKLHKSDQWTPGRVFKVLWSEPHGENNPNGTVVTKGTVEKGKHGEKVYQSIRRFVIVARGKGPGNHHSTCVPILTYGHQGALKGGANLDSHALVYMSKESEKNPKPPKPRTGEDFLRDPIRVVPQTDRDKLHLYSRINYAKIYTVEHNVKVLFIGQIHSKSVGRFMTAFNDVWGNNDILGGGG